MSSEDPKKDMNESRESRNKPFVGISLLIISLLLVVSVSALIYQNVVSNQCDVEENPEAQPAVVVGVEAEVTLNDGDDQESDRIEFDQNQNVAYFYKEDGGFEVADFSKGIRITKSKFDGICYLSAVGTGNQTGDYDFAKILREINGRELTVVRNRSEERVNAVVLPGKVKDVSFIPAGAHKECTRGYKWMSFVPAEDMETEADRTKRDTLLTYCHVWHCDILHLIYIGLTLVDEHYHCWHWNDHREDFYTYGSCSQYLQALSLLIIFYKIWSCPHVSRRRAREGL